MPSVRRWLMGRKQRKVAAFVSEKVDYLFRQVRHPWGHEYTVEDVAPGDWQTSDVCSWGAMCVCCKCWSRGTGGAR